MSHFKQRLSAHAALTEQELEHRLPSLGADPADTLHEAMRYAVLGGGKRLRAHLVFEFCALCGGKQQASLIYAAAMEMMHAFSLIHDDLPCMDNDTLRRGKPTVHVAFGEAAALLAGDALALLALRVVNDNPYVADNGKAVEVLSEASLLMCDGQQMDLQSEQKQIGLDELRLLVDRKTGALFSASCRLGCIAAGASDECIAHAKAFGEWTGLAFQITDDLLDIRSDAKSLGKTPGKDVKSCKSTFVSLLGQADAERIAREACEQAKKQLAGFADSEAKDSLLDYCDSIVGREK